MSTEPKKMPEESIRMKRLSLEIPKGGVQIDLGDDFVFTLKPLNRDVLKMARKLIMAGDGIGAALAGVNTLAVAGSATGKEISDEDISTLIGLENAFAELIEARDFVIKKN